MRDEAHPRADARQLWHFALDLRRFLRSRISVARAREVVRWRLDHREQLFLSLAKRAIYQYPHSPYRPLLEIAQCEWRDLERMVRSRGIESTLKVLKQAGVWIAFDEFKGRRPLVRSGRSFVLRESAFNNPCLVPAWHTRTGGSTGMPTAVPVDLRFVAEKAVYKVLRLEAYGVREYPHGLWYPPPPLPAGPWCVLCHAKAGRAPVRWFTPVTSRQIHSSLRQRCFVPALGLTGLTCGVRLPRLKLIELADAVRIARWMSRSRDRYGGCLLSTFVSSAVRVCAAARGAGLDLSNTWFFLAGEPLTEAKAEQIQSVGAKAVPGYGATEVAGIGGGCLRPEFVDELHLFTDSVAVIQDRSQARDGDVAGWPLLLTSLLPTSPKVLVNVELDDYGLIVRRHCGCPWDKAGFTVHLHHVRSIRKLTSEGMTVLGFDAVRLVENILPREFGGDVGSFQLLQDDDGRGVSRLTVLANPDIGPLSQEAVISRVLEHVQQSTRATSPIWRQAGTVKVQRRRPFRTQAGKCPPVWRRGIPEENQDRLNSGKKEH